MPTPPLIVAALMLAALAGAQQPRFVEAKATVTGEWKGRETRLLDTAGIQPLPPDALTRFGGLAAEKREATGFFRVEKINDRWWMIDPEGGRFIFTGLCSVKPQTKLAAKAPFDQLFGTTQAWTHRTLDLLRAHRFNGIGGFADHETLRAAPSPLPYTVTLSLMSSFGKKLRLTHAQSGHTGYASDCLPVFHPDFEKHCLDQCRERLAAMTDDPWLVGVFSDNELPVAKDMLDRMLKLDDSNPAFASMREAAQAFINGKNTITDDLRRDFVQHVFDTYFRRTTQAIRQILPHHLCLGSRFHGPATNASGAWKAAGQWCDAISFNYYGQWKPRSEHLQQWHAWSGKPCLITEFYVKGADSGLGNSTGAGWLVKTQADRGLFYQNFTLALLESKTCVGWHWFKYMDNDPADSTTDASNKDSNKGILDARYQPYTPLLDAMRELNARIYPLIQQFDASKP